MSAYVDLVRFIPAAGGTGDWVFANAVAGCQSPAAANVQNGVSYKLYSVSTDQSQWETVQGVCSVSAGVYTFPRTTVLANSLGTGTSPGQSGAGTKINFATIPQVAIVALAEDLISVEVPQTFTQQQQKQALENIGAWVPGNARLTFNTTAATGWVLLNDGSIGNAASGATTRANADTSDLFTVLYNAIPSLVLQNSSGTTVARGASAAADYAANTRLLLPKTLGRALGVAGAGAGLTAQTLGVPAGNPTETLITANLPPYTPAGSVATQTQTQVTANLATYNAIGGSNENLWGNSTGGVGGLSAASQSQSQFAGSPQGGTSTPFSLMQPTTFLNVEVKL